jgi:hypothetical protein
LRACSASSSSGRADSSVTGNPSGPGTPVEFLGQRIVQHGQFRAAYGVGRGMLKRLPHPSAFLKELRVVKLPDPLRLRLGIDACAEG